MRHYVKLGMIVLLIIGFGGLFAIADGMWILAWVLGYSALLLVLLCVLVALRHASRFGSTQFRNVKKGLQKLDSRVSRADERIATLIEKVGQSQDDSDIWYEAISDLRRSYENIATDVRYKVSRHRGFTPSLTELSQPPRALLNARLRTLVVNFDSVLDGIIKQRPDTNFNQSFFASDTWPARPNSTQRLNFTNYQALRTLRPLLDFDFVFHLDLPDNISRFFDGYDVVIIMQAPNAKSKHTLIRILEEMKRRPTQARVVFGTEITWFAELERGTLNSEQIREVYTRHTLLRHTARTDMQIYDDDEFDNSSIQEFEIGLDTDVVRPNTAIEDRQVVLFVKAPEGRSTKKNDDVDTIYRAIIKDPSLNHLELVILTPPYSTTQYWDLLQRTRYLVFTSIGETFSYVLNDAKAAGVVGFFPSRMYENRTPKYTIDSYPDMPGRYSNLEMLLEMIRGLENDPRKLRDESRRAREYVVENFSVTKIATNWANLITDKPLNNETIFLAQLDDRDFPLHKALEVCHNEGYRYLLPYLNIGTEDLPQDVYSWVDPTYEVAILRDFIYDAEGRLRRTRGLDGSPARGPEGALIESLPKNEILEFWRILIRVNKINRIVTNLSQNNELLDVLRSQLTYRFNSHYEFVPIEIEHYSERD